MSNTIRLRRAAGSLLGLLILSACASSSEILQFASAPYVGSNVRLETIIISNVQRGATEVRWLAAVPGRPEYACRADDMVRRAYCIPR